MAVGMGTDEAQVQVGAVVDWGEVLALEVVDKDVVLVDLGVGQVLGVVEDDLRLQRSALRCHLHLNVFHLRH